MGKFIDLTGKTFGYLKVLEKSQKRDNDGNVYWICECKCGKIKEINSRCLRTGQTISCGCYNLEHNQKTLGQHKYTETHGKSNTRLYFVYRTMINRCYNPKTKKYKNYGGRGITVCNEWKNDFSVFYNWAILNGYDENAEFMKCTIDRIDNDGNYCPENCRWVDNYTQAKNKTSVYKITFKGKTQTIREWAEELEIKAYTIYQRLRKDYPIEICLQKGKIENETYRNRCSKEHC